MTALNPQDDHGTQCKNRRTKKSVSECVREINERKKEKLQPRFFFRLAIITAHVLSLGLLMLQGSHLFAYFVYLL